MEILEKSLGNIKRLSLVLGFFDGIHLGHRRVIESAIKLGNKTALLTFTKSPSEYFKKQTEYIYPREYSYKLIGNIGVDYIIERDFNEIVNITAEDYLKSIVNEFSPVSITTGFNYTFGHNKEGNIQLLKSEELKYGYKYYYCEPYTVENKTVSSTYIKELLKLGDIEKANELLVSPFVLTSKVIKGAQIGRKLGYPTANMIYPQNIVKIPYGVYKVLVFDRPAIMNWGIKPTLNGENEGLEVHILNYDGDLYGKELSIKIISKIRDEKKFNSLDELKSQIKKDAEICLE